MTAYLSLLLLRNDQGNLRGRTEKMALPSDPVTYLIHWGWQTLTLCRGHLSFDHLIGLLRMERKPLAFFLG